MITVVLFIIKKTYRNGKILWLIIMYWLWLKISRGVIWIGTLGGGVQSLNPKTGLFTTYNTTSAGLISDYVSSLCMGKEGSLWIGTVQGLSELDIETKKVVNLEGTKSGKEYFF